jgi:signal transduction histidine kinase
VQARIAGPVAVPAAANLLLTAVAFAAGTVLDSPVLRESLASGAGLALTNDRLRARTLAQVAELQASQVRIVRSGDAERRRLERDLHDGAQQRVVGIMLGLRLLRTTPGAAPGLLQRAETEVGQAIDDLRALSHGLFPTVLSDEGLAAALHALAETQRVTVGPVPTLRFAAELETTAYLVVARAASTGAAAVDASHDAGHLVVRIRADGHFDGHGLSDRITALAGTLTAHQDEDGCRVTLTLPTTTVNSHGHPSPQPSTQRLEEHP